MAFLEILKNGDNVPDQRIKYINITDHSSQYPHFTHEQKRTQFFKSKLGNSTNYKFNSIKKNTRKNMLRHNLPTRYQVF